MTKITDGFHTSSIPEFYIGTGIINRLITLSRTYGVRKPFFITGAHSLDENGTWKRIEDMFANPVRERVAAEPDPDLVDAICDDARAFGADGIISIGGGSVLDTGKAVSAMCTEQGSVQNYLEGVGTREPSGSKIPHIAVPTTSGTGSEATKNAVISRIGPNGFKKSLRHDNFVPDAVIIDAELLTGSSELVFLSSGMDAITQLLESYLSTAANTFTDALAIEGLEYALVAIENVRRDPLNHQHRLSMAYAAFLSGITLANAGLGVVHGFASVLGAAQPIPHGIACAILLPDCTNTIAARILSDPEADEITFRKLCKVASLTEKQSSLPGMITAFVNRLESMKRSFSFPSLASFGFTHIDLPGLAAASGIKNTPVSLDDTDKLAILQKCL